MMKVQQTIKKPPLKNIAIPSFNHKITLLIHTPNSWKNKSNHLMPYYILVIKHNYFFIPSKYNIKSLKKNQIMIINRLKPILSILPAN